MSERGRPKSPCDLTPENFSRILDMYRAGASDAEVKAYIHDVRGTFSNDLWERWMREEPSFSEAITRGRMLSQAWWEAQGRFNLANRDFQFRGWEINMSNRFDWSQKTKNELTGANGGPIKTEVTVPAEDKEILKRFYETNKDAL